MPTACPHCQFANPDRAVACGRCGWVLSNRTAADAAPASNPVTEPIHMATGSHCDPPSARPASTVALSAASAAALASDRGTDTPSARATPAVAPPTQDGTNRLPGYPRPPMNDASVQNPPNTVPATAPADAAQLPAPPAPAGKPKLVVLRGLKIGTEYPVYEGRNTVGRFADRPVDIDLVSQESVEQIWCSRQHAVVTLDRGVVVVEDLNSLNGTWVNGIRIHPGQHHPLNAGDVVQIGTVQLKLVFG